jgi:hypothetical protein
MTANEFRHFLRCQPGTLSFIESYLVSVNEDNVEKVFEMRKQIEANGDHLEEILFDDILRALLPYFKANQSIETEDIKLSTRNELYLEQKNSIETIRYIDESDENWAGERRVLAVFLDSLKRVQNYKWIQANLNKIFPMVCQVLDDYRSENKKIGIDICREFLRIVPKDIILKFNLHMVLYESFKVNVSFDSESLVFETLILWIRLIEKTEIHASKSFLKRSDELLLLLCRDIGITSKIGRIVVFLRAMAELLNLMQYCAIRYLRKVVVTLCESVKENWSSDELVLAGQDAMAVLIKNCWVRITVELKDIIIDTFGGNKEISSLLESINL